MWKGQQTCPCPCRSCSERVSVQTLPHNHSNNHRNRFNNHPVQSSWQSRVNSFPISCPRKSSNHPIIIPIIIQNRPTKSLKSPVFPGKSPVFHGFPRENQGFSHPFPPKKTRENPPWRSFLSCCDGHLEDLRNDGILKGDGSIIGNNTGYIITVI